MSPRDDDKGNYDDTEFPADSENNEAGRKRSDTPAGDTGRKTRRSDSDDEGDYDDKDQ
jgi:hypothetical protein